MPDVSISLVNTNSRELLLACLESLRGAGAEIVVLDNASEDGSVAAVRERFPAVRLIEQRHRAGFGANHNTVIRATTGRYVFILNEDTTSRTGASSGWSRTSTRTRASPRSRRGSSIPTGGRSPRRGASRLPRPPRSGCSRSAARASSSRAEARRATSTGRWPPRCSSGAKRSTKSAVRRGLLHLLRGDGPLRVGSAAPAGGRSSFRRSRSSTTSRSSARVSRAADQRDVARPAPLLAEAPLGAGARAAALSPARSTPCGSAPGARPRLRGADAPARARRDPRPRPGPPRARRGLEPRACRAGAERRYGTIRARQRPGGCVPTAQRTRSSRSQAFRVRVPQTAVSVRWGWHSRVHHRPDPGGGGDGRVEIAAARPPRRRREAIRTICRVNLESDGMKVVEAADGREAIGAIRRSTGTRPPRRDDAGRRRLEVAAELAADAKRGHPGRLPLGAGDARGPGARTGARCGRLRREAVRSASSSAGPCETCSSASRAASASS